MGLLSTPQLFQGDGTITPADDVYFVVDADESNPAGTHTFWWYDQDHAGGGALLMDLENASGIVTFTVAGDIQATTATYSGAVRMDSLGIGVAPSGSTGDATFSDGTRSWAHDASAGEVTHNDGTGDMHVISMAVGGTTVWNERGLDLNHRWEGVSQTNALFIQGSDGFVGMGNAAPSAQLDVTGSIRATVSLGVGVAPSGAAGDANFTDGTRDWLWDASAGTQTFSGYDLTTTPYLDIRTAGTSGVPGIRFFRTGTFAFSMFAGTAGTGFQIADASSSYPGTTLWSGLLTRQHFTTTATDATDMSGKGIDMNSAFLRLGDPISGNTLTNGVGIKLHDAGVAFASIHFKSSAKDLEFGDSSANANSIAIASPTLVLNSMNSNPGNVYMPGSVMVGANSAPSFELHVTGDLKATISAGFGSSDPSGATGDWESGDGTRSFGLDASAGKVTLVSGQTDAHAIANPPFQLQGTVLVIGDQGGGGVFTNGMGIKFHDAGVAHASIKFTGSSKDMVFGDSSASGNSLAVASPTLSLIGMNSNPGKVQIHGEAEIDGALNHDGSTIGFYGTAPAAQSAAYTINATAVEDRTLLASASATTLNNNNVLAALLADLQAIGLLG